MNDIIKLENVSKYYGRSRGVIELDFSVLRGEIFGYLGPNGAGKTTTIRLLIDLLRPTSGHITVLGESPNYPSIRRRIGYLPGELNLYKSLTGSELLIYLSSLKGMPDTGIADELAIRLNLDLSKRIKTLSKGNKQKLGLIQALMSKPELLILDEPTSGLDPLVQLECYEILKETRKAGATIFLSSHILPEVERLADRVAIIREGKITVIDTLSTFRSKAIKHFEIHFSANSKIDHSLLHQLLNVETVSDVKFSNDVLNCSITGSIDPLIKIIAKYEVKSLITSEQDLETMFLSHYSTTNN